MKDIYFFTHNDSNASGSCTMRGPHIKNYLIKYYNCYCSTDINNIKNSIVIFLKDNYNLNLDILKISKNNNNINVIDMIDYCVFYSDENNYGYPDFIENSFINYIDAIIVNNINSKELLYNKYNKYTYVIPHHYDFRLDSVNFSKNNEISFIFNGYIGHVNKNSLFLNCFENENFTICNDFFDFISSEKYKKCNCHISLRDKDSWEFKTKPAMKLAHAVGTNSNIITTYDMSVRDLLDENYPYIIKDLNQENVKNMIEYVKKTYNTEIWYKGLEILKKLKEKLSIKNIVKEYYCDFFENIDKLFN
jgi:hypothetical protein